jgi:hypothetical protein
MIFAKDCLDVTLFYEEYKLKHPTSNYLSNPRNSTPKKTSCTFPFNNRLNKKDKEWRCELQTYLDTNSACADFVTNLNGRVTNSLKFLHWHQYVRIFLGHSSYLCSELTFSSARIITYNRTIARKYTVGLVCLRN